MEASRSKRPFVRSAFAALTVFGACAGLATPAAAQPVPVLPRMLDPSLGPTLRLEAQASREVTDDTVSASLFIEREGPQPAPLQSAVNGVLQSAIADLKADQKLPVRSGSYTTRPRYGRDNRIEGWRVRAEVIVESSDAPALSQAVAQVAGRLSVAAIGVRLSNERRTQTENALAAEAADRFHEKARIAAKALGFGSVELVDVGLNTAMPPVMPIQQRAMAMAAPAADATVPMPIEPGRSLVTVTFSGTVRLKK